MYALNPSGGKECLAGEEILVGESEHLAHLRLLRAARSLSRGVLFFQHEGEVNEIHVDAKKDLTKL